MNLITSGTLERYPGVRVVVPHCGSFLPNILSRLTGITALLASKGLCAPVDVTKSMDSLYFDIAGDALPAGIPILETIAPPEHILFGSDYPYTPAPMIHAKLQSFSAAMDEAKRRRIYRANALKLLGRTD